MPAERLQKIIAAAGIASRRKAEELIQSGLVSVNGQVVTELGTKADPETDSIRVNNKLLKGPERHEYLVLNKPKGYVTTVSDPEGRPTVMELVHSKARLYPIGRLDFNSEGLLLLTNDGELAHKLMKAASHIPKTYLVKVAGQPAEDQLRRLRAGISIAEERDPNRRVRTAPAQIRIIKEADNPWLEVTLHEGRNRQIRKMFEEIGHHVEKIRRVRYGPLELNLPPGGSRSLTPREVDRLLQATTQETKPRFHEDVKRFGERPRSSASSFQRGRGKTSGAIRDDVPRFQKADRQAPSPGRRSLNQNSVENQTARRAGAPGAPLSGRRNRPAERQFDQPKSRDDQRRRRPPFAPERQWKRFKSKPRFQARQKPSSGRQGGFRPRLGPNREFQPPTDQWEEREGAPSKWRRSKLPKDKRRRRS